MRMIKEAQADPVRDEPRRDGVPIYSSRSDQFGQLVTPDLLRHNAHAFTSYTGLVPSQVPEALPFKFAEA